jgi:hypothetical protein
MSIKTHISNSAFYLCDGFKNLSLELNLKMWAKFGIQNHILANYNSLEPDFYQLITDNLGVSPSEFFLVDDTLKNVTAARQAGWEAHHWQGTQPFAGVIDGKF